MKWFERDYRMLVDRRDKQEAFIQQEYERMRVNEEAVLFHDDTLLLALFPYRDFLAKFVIIHRRKAPLFCAMGSHGRYNEWEIVHELYLTMLRTMAGNLTEEQAKSMNAAQKLMEEWARLVPQEKTREWQKSLIRDEYLRFGKKYKGSGEPHTYLSITQRSCKRLCARIEATFPIELANQTVWDNTLELMLEHAAEKDNEETGWLLKMEKEYGVTPYYGKAGLAKSEDAINPNAS